MPTAEAQSRALGRSPGSSAPIAFTRERVECTRLTDVLASIHPGILSPLMERYPDATLQRTGHGAMVETPDGEWYLTHLCGRPIAPDLRRCPMGRESALSQK